MNYELVNVIQPSSPVWQKERARLLQDKGQVITVAPMPDFNKIKQEQGVDGLNILDYVTKREHDPNGFLFFNQIPTATNAEIFMNESWTVSLINDGEEIGEVTLFPGTRRHVKEVKYLNRDGSIDFVEEYADDGAIFSNIFYFDGQVQQIDFFNSSKLPVVSYFFYEGQNNFVIIRDPETFEVVERYENSYDFIASQVAKIVTAEDQVTINYMGVEMLALSKSNSHNILHLEESPLDEEGNIKGNLLGILNDHIPYIQEVRMEYTYYQQLVDKDVSLAKVVVTDKVAETV